MPTLSSVNTALLPTILEGSVNASATGYTPGIAPIGVNYASLVNAGNQSADTDGYQVLGANVGALYVNTGTLAAPNYKLLNFGTAITDPNVINIAAGGTLSANTVVTIRITGVFYNGAKISGSDSKLYWYNGTSPDYSGTTSAFNIKAIDNFDGVWGGANDTASSATFSGGAVTATSGPDVNADGSVKVYLTVTDVNDAPTFTLSAPSITVNEDSANGGTTYQLTSAQAPGPAPYENAQTITYTASVTAGGSLVTGVSVSASGLLSYTTVPDANGTVTIDVRSQDNGGTANGGVDTSTTKTFTINITPVNDAPIISSNGAGATAAIGVNEGQTAVTTVTSTDIDGGTPVYSISGGADAAFFTINTATGVLTFVTAPSIAAMADADHNNIYQVTVQVSDGGTVNATDTQALSVSLNDVNDPPTVTSGATGSVAENAAISTVVYTVTATDPDASAPNNTLSYSLTGTDAALFNISAGGAVTLKASADFEAKSSYSINVVATDGGTPPLSNSKAVTINVTDVNEAPTVTSGATGSVAENAATSTVVYTATATDPDGTAPNNTLTYSLSGTDAAAFSISAGGAVTLNSSANYEAKSSYSINVVATDGGAGALSNSKAVTINVTDVNEAPTVTSGATGSVAENAATSTVVYTATATDPDGTAPNNTLTYSLSGTDAAAFSISAGGAVTLNSSANYEAKSSYSINVVATDGGAGALSNSKAVTINVTDVNEAPTVTSGATGSVAENAATSTVVYTATATDPDGTAPNNTLTYSLSGTDAAAFSISAGGAVTLNSSANYEAKSSYSINVVATDGGAGALSNSKAVTINVTDVNEAPTVTSGATGSVAENAATSTVVYTATATDPDGTAPNNTLTYSLSGTDAAAFSISAGGAVTLNSSANYEAKSSYSINVVATDGGAGALSNSKAVTINVTDVNEAPTVTSGATGSVVEGAPISTVVYTVTATDPDTTAPNNTLTYSLSGTDAAAFNISAGGDVTLKASANYVTKSSYSINVIATDAGTGALSNSKAVTINVTDINDAPTVTSGATGSVAENAAISTVVYTVTATDPDLTAPNNTLSYSLTGTDAALFNISAGGAVTLKASANFEAKSSYSINVVATDGGTPPLSNSKAVTINVTDVNEAPTVTSGATGSVAENAATSTVVYTATATDPDGTAPNNTLTYSLSGTDAAAFSISAGGAVTLNSSANYEAKSSYSINVVATDGGAGALSNSKAVTINVTDVNEAPTVTSGATGSVAENAATSTVVYTATATDPDGTAPNNTLTYSLSGTDAAAFSISAGGAVTLNSSANYEAKSSYSINVVATDGGAGALSNSKAVTINVTDVNEAPTVTSGATGSVAENAATSTVVYTATATDPDGTAPNNTLTYSLTGTDAALFNISAGGAVTLKASANFEAKSSYSINVVATDGGAGALSNSKAVTINVTDVNEAPSITGGATASVSVVAGSTAVTTVLGTDPDTTAPNNTLSYSLTGGADKLLFSINSSGVLTFLTGHAYNPPGDAGADNVYDVTVTVTDGGALTAVQAIAVTLTPPPPTPHYTGSSVDTSTRTITLDGYNINSLLATSQTAATDIKANFDFSKFMVDFDGAGGTAAAAPFVAADVSSVKVLNDNSLQIVFNSTADWTAFTGNANFGYAGNGATDLVSISNGFSATTANVHSTTDAVSSLPLLGPLNETGLPQTFTVGNLYGGATGAANESLGTTVTSIDFAVPNVVDSVTFAATTSAAKVALSGAASGGGNAASGSLVIKGVDIFATGSGNLLSITGISGELDANSKILFADGSILRTNTGASDTLTGTSHDDQLVAGNNGDRLVGNAGNDVLIGGDGADALYGGNGADIFYGGKGNDYLSAGGSSSSDTYVDTFVYTAYADSEGSDVISGFRAGNTNGDKIYLADSSSLSTVTATNLLATVGAAHYHDATYGDAYIAQNGADTVIVLNDFETIRLLGVTATSLTAANFAGGTGSLGFVQGHAI